MKFQGALIQEQGIKFGIVVVQPHVINNSHEVGKAQIFGCQMFGRVPIVLMSQNHRGTPTYLGRPDIVKFLANVHPSRIPWREYTVA